MAYHGQNRAAVCNAHDIPSVMFAAQTLNDCQDPGLNRGQALPVGWAFVGRKRPETGEAVAPRGRVVTVRAAMKVTEILLADVGLLTQFRKCVACSALIRRKCPLTNSSAPCSRHR